MVNTNKQIGSVMYVCLKKDMLPEGGLVLGITHVFSCINIFAGSQESCFNTRLVGVVFKNLLRDRSSVNAMNQTCVIIIIA